MRIRNRLLFLAARTFLWTMAGVGFVSFFGIAALRLPYPLELGNMEGLMMDHIVRLAQGRPLYVKPTLEFIPLAYMPGFPALVAPLARLFGPALWQGRLVDLIAVSGLALLMIWIVRRETGSLTLGIGSAGLFLMGQGISRGGYDVVRPDPVMLLFAFAGLATLRFTTHRWGAVASALLLSLSFYFKQHGLCFAVAALLYALRYDSRRIAFALTLALGCGGTFLLLSQWLGPWFSFYVLEVPSHWSRFDRMRMLDYVRFDLLGRLGGLTIPSLLALVLPHRPWRGSVGLWWWAGLGGVLTGFIAMLDPYAYFHVLMPSIAAFALLGPLSIHYVAARLAESDPHAPPRALSMPGPPPGQAERRRERRTRAKAAHAIACVLVGLQYLPLLYPVRGLLPHPRPHEAETELIARLQALPGRVILPFHGYYGWLAGKGTALGVLPLDDVIRARNNHLIRRDPRFFEELFDPLRRGPGRPIIVSDTLLTQVPGASAPLWASLERSYRLAGTLGELTARLRPVAGNRNAPALIYVPVEPPASDSLPASR